MGGETPRERVLIAKSEISFMDLPQRLPGRLCLPRRGPIVNG